MKKEKILHFLSEASRTGEEIFEFMMGAGQYKNGGISGGLRSLADLKKRRWRTQYTTELLRVERIRTRRLVESLRYDGLIKSKKSGHRSSYSIANKGKQCLQRYVEKAASAIVPKKYTTEHADSFNIIMYDIPDRRRRYRDWLRGVLVDLGFKSLQKSVFIGKFIFSQELTDDLTTMKLWDYIQVCKITKRGTLRVLR